MKLWVGVTDNDWFRFLAARPDLDEVNFWQPSGSRTFRALAPGEPFLFKLHSPLNFIAGGGLFAGFSRYPVDLAWEAFGEKNGVESLNEMRLRLAKYRRVSPDPRENYVIGCIILRAPFFFPREMWMPAPPEFPKHVQQGMTFDTEMEAGSRLWAEFEQRTKIAFLDRGITKIDDTRAMWSEPCLVRQRLGQGSFKLLVAETYQRRCAVTGEKALPVLEAAHIRPVTADGRHRIDNGLLLRSDVHTLFDRGYITVTPQHQIRISRRLKDDFDNGEHYYKLDRHPIWLPKRHEDRPNREFLEWHADSVFRG